MNFERTGNSIRNLSRGDISLDEMLEMLLCVTRDVYEINGVKKVSDMKADDPEQMLLRMNSLMEMLLKVYKVNQEKLKLFKDEEFEAEIAENALRVEAFQSEFSGIANALDEARADLEKLQNETDQKKRELAEKENELDAARKKVLKVEEQTQKARKDIESAMAQIENADRTESEIREKKMGLTAILSALDSMKNDKFLAEKLFGSADADVRVDAKADLAVAGKKIDSWETLGSWTDEMERRIDGLTAVLGTVQKELVIRAEHLTDSPKQK